MHDAVIGECPIGDQRNGFGVIVFAVIDLSLRCGKTWLRKALKDKEERDMQAVSIKFAHTVRQERLLLQSPSLHFPPSIDARLAREAGLRVPYPPAGCVSLPSPTDGRVGKERITLDKEEEDGSD